MTAELPSFPCPFCEKAEIELQPYQIKALELIRERTKFPTDMPVLIVMPTDSMLRGGKTQIMLDMLHEKFRDQPVVFLDVETLRLGRETGVISDNMKRLSGDVRIRLDEQVEKLLLDSIDEIIPIRPIGDAMNQPLLEVERDTRPWYRRFERKGKRK